MISFKSRARNSQAMMMSFLRAVNCVVKRIEKVFIAGNQEADIWRQFAFKLNRCLFCDAVFKYFVNVKRRLATYWLFYQVLVELKQNRNITTGDKT
jgi:hypothetical protein